LIKNFSVHFATLACFWKITVDQSKRSEMSTMQGLSQQAYMTSTLSMVMESALCLRPAPRK
jgi:hypothetical protein